jgi:hypothetical protein
LQNEFVLLVENVGSTTIATINAAMLNWDQAFDLQGNQILSLADGQSLVTILNIETNGTVSWPLLYLLEKLWLRLAESSRHLLLVVPREEARMWLNSNVSNFECHCYSSVDEAVSASKSLLPSLPVTLLSDSELATLAALRDRFEALVVDRIGDMYPKEHSLELPDIVRLLRVGRSNGCFWFPHGSLRWQFERLGEEWRLTYKDRNRVASGWGCHYEITPRETVLVEDDLD